MGKRATATALLLLLPLLLLSVPGIKGELTSFSLLGERTSEHSCLTQAYTEAKPEALKEPLGIKFVGSSDECTGREVNTLNMDDADEVSGKVAVFRMCSGATSYWEYYWDYFFKAFELEERGAVMVIPVEAWTAKLPEHMDGGELTRTLGIPVCIMEKPKLASLLSILDENPDVQGAFNSLTFYNSKDEPELDTPITAITVKLDSNHTLTLPATTSTFNNASTPAVSGTLLPLRLRPQCYHNPTDDWAQCVACWSSDRIGNEAGPVENFREIVDSSQPDERRVLFVGLEGQGELRSHFSTCFNFYYHWAVFGAQLLVDAVVIGGLSDRRLVLPGPYLVGSRTVPTFSIINMHSDTFSIFLSEEEEHGNATVTLPALKEQQGPPFYAHIQAEPGFTWIGFWNASLATAGNQDHHLSCLAGQATFNPERHGGSDLPGIDLSGNVILTNSSRKVVYVRPSEDCADSATCGRCLSKPYGKLDFDSNIPYGESVVLLYEDDFPCFHSHSDFSKAAVEVGPYALIVAQLGPSSHTVADSELSHLAFPTYAVDRECGIHLIGDCDPETAQCPETLYVKLPQLVDGVAVHDERDEREAYIKFLSPESLAKKEPQAMGQVNFNPMNSDSVSGGIISAQTIEACNSEYTCLYCDLVEWRWKQDRSAFKDRIALINLYSKNDGEHRNAGMHQVQGHCLLPWSNMVMELQSAGAIGVLFVNPVDSIFTHVEQGVSREEIKIPSFNVPSDLGKRIQSFESSGVAPEARLPPIENGDAVNQFPDTEPSGNTGGPPLAEDFISPKPVLPGWAIALTTIGAILVLFACGFVTYYIRRRRRMYAYNQMDSAVQADILADVMSMPTCGDFEEGGFHDEPLDSGGSGSDDEGVGRYGYAQTENGGSGMQMVELTNGKPSARSG